METRGSHEAPLFRPSVKHTVSIYCTARAKFALHAPRYALRLRTRAANLSTKEIRFTARHNSCGRHAHVPVFSVLRETTGMP